MSKLIGTAPNQVPTNADLGSAAYIDSNTILKSSGITTDGLVSWINASYTGGEPTDISGNGNDFTLINDPPYVSEPVGYWQLNGTNQGLERQGGAALFDSAKQNYTMEIWLADDTDYDVDNTARNWHPFGIGQQPADGGSDTTWYMHNNYGNYMYFQYESTDGSTYTPANYPRVGPKPGPGKWFYVALVIQGSNRILHLYLNGEMVWSGRPASDSDTAAMRYEATHDIQLGKDPRYNTGESGRHLKGKIAEYRAYDRPLLPDEIKSNYLASKAKYGK